MPLSIALNASFPEQHAGVWKQLRSTLPNAPIIAHGINNSTALLPLGRGLDQQEAYIHQTLDSIEKYAGVRPRGGPARAFTRMPIPSGRPPPPASAIRSTPWTPIPSPGSRPSQDCSCSCPIRRSRSIWGNFCSGPNSPAIWSGCGSTMSANWCGRPKQILAARPRWSRSAFIPSSWARLTALQHCVAFCNSSELSSSLWVTDVQALLDVVLEKR